MNSLRRELYRISQYLPMKTENVIVLKRELHKRQLDTYKCINFRIVNINNNKQYKFNQKKIFT